MVTRAPMVTCAPMRTGATAPAAWRSPTLWKSLSMMTTNGPSGTVAADVYGLLGGDGRAIGDAYAIADGDACARGSPAAWGPHGMGHQQEVRTDHDLASAADVGVSIHSGAPMPAWVALRRAFADGFYRLPVQRDRTRAARKEWRCPS